MKLSPKAAQWLTKLLGLNLLFFLVISGVSAQRPRSSSANGVAASTAPGSYDISQDVSLQGSVLKFTENSAAPPLGAHLLLQTASGSVDVHIGNSRLLQNARMNLAAGANLRVIGQMQAFGKSQVFFARLVQQGSQLVAVRSDRGLPLSPSAVRAARASGKPADTKQQGGAR
jgi:hypothetical protein